MNAFQRVLVIGGYEWKRALAKKKVIALVILAILVQVLPFIAFTRLSSDFFPEDARATMWIFGALGGQSLFIQLVAIIIAGGSMSEEYEHGTADLLLSKPIKRREYLAGKFLGGFLLLIAVEALMVVTGVIMAFGFFGVQSQLQFAPVIFAAIVYSSLLFFSLSFMFSEVFRRGMLAILASIGVYIVSQILYGVLIVLYSFSNASGQPISLYLDIGKALPTWSAGNLPNFLAAQLMPTLRNPLVTLVTGDIGLSAAIVAIYAIVFVAIAVIRLLRSDVTKKAD